MLTIEMLRQNATLTGLTDAQLTAIAEMSKNDENTVIGTKIGALHGQYDSDILNVTGIKKNDGEKSYDYAKRVLNEYKSQIQSTATLQAQLTNAKNEVATLKQKLADGAGDETLKQQLKDAKAQVSQLQTQLSTKESEFSTTKAELEGQIKNVHVDYAFKAATAGLKFKAGITEGVQKILLDSAKAEVLAKGTPDFIDNGSGGKTLVFRNADGNVLNNPKNNLNPYTVQELIMETQLKDVIEIGRTQPGASTVPPTTPPGASTLLDLSGIKTQLEADKAIENYLLTQGLTRDSAEFAEQSMQLRSDNSVGQLPIR